MMWLAYRGWSFAPFFSAGGETHSRKQRHLLSIERLKLQRKLRNITSKLDPLYLLSIKKVVTKKGIPYQTLVQQG
jgi:predicted DNA binding CopG/RHH family protein